MAEQDGRDTVRMFVDEWLRPTVAEIVGQERIAEIRQSERYRSLWDAVVELGLSTDEELLGSLSTRFRLKLADLSQSERTARDLVPEGVAGRYQVLPITVPASTLAVAPPDPFDIDCEEPSQHP